MLDTSLESTADIQQPFRLTEWFARVLGLRKKLIIMGTGHLAENLLMELDRGVPSRYEVVGMLTQDPHRIGQAYRHTSIIGTVNDLPELVDELGAQAVAVCADDRRGNIPMVTLVKARLAGSDVYDGRQLYDESCGKLSINEFRPGFTVFSSTARRKWLIVPGKRLQDVVGAIAGLLLFLPLIPLIALLIKLDSPGPVFYRQQRVGLHGKPYTILKFRSMSGGSVDDAPRWSIENQRITRTGKWLRCTHLDEIPQLLNVLRGEMSLVGSRPERPEFVNRLSEAIPYYELRHTVKPGITGWAQIQYHYAASIEESRVKLQYDLFYVRHMTFMLDIKVLLRTIKVVLKGNGA